MKFLKNIFRKKTKKEKLSSYCNYISACVCCGEIDPKEAMEDLSYYKKKLYKD